MFSLPVSRFLKHVVGQEALFDDLFCRENLCDLRHLLFAHFVRHAVVGLAQDGSQEVLVVGEAEVVEERAPALVDVAERDGGEEDVFERSSEI